MTDDDYDELFRTAYPRLVALGLSMSAERHVAQELAQETLLRAYHHRHDLDRMESPLGWCRRVMGNLLIDHHRSRLAERAANERALAQTGSATGATGPADPAHLAAAPRWAELVAPLTPQQRLIATLYYAEDQPVDAVAAALDVSAGTVKSGLAKVRANLRRSLGVTRSGSFEKEARS